MDQRAKELIRRGEDMFTRRQPFLTLWQEQADNFYPERADFTATRNLGQDFASNLMTSYPILARRDLGNSISAMLRPNNQDWFQISVARDDRLDNAGKAWLQSKSKVMRRAMYDRVSQFVRATKEGDHDFAAFGQCIISTELSQDRSSLLYRCWHLRDVAWCEDYAGKIDTIFRKWKPTVRELSQIKSFTLDPKVVRMLEKDPYQTIHVFHAVIPAKDYDTYAAKDQNGDKSKKWQTPYVSIYIDVTNQAILSEEGAWTTIYTIPRWQTVSGCQYANSPATIAALPDARLLQSMTLVLLEAGEKAVNPPMLAMEDAIRSDISVFAGGIIWGDPNYDEKTGEMLRPLNIDTRNIPVGFDMRDKVVETIKEAFYLNKLMMPPAGDGEMTAFEVGQRVQEYIRNALPLFEPMETEYNGSLCENTFEIMMRAGAFGSVYDMPQSLHAQDVVFKFQSPLQEATDKMKVQILGQAIQLVDQVMPLDPTAATIIDFKAGLREALEGNQTPAAWLRSPEDAQALQDQIEQQHQQAAALQTATQGGQAAQFAGQAAKNFSEADLGK